MILYSIYNKQTERFNPPFVARDDDDAIETCRKAIIAGRDISLLVELENLDLCSICDFDAKTGICFPGEPEQVLQLSHIALPEHIKNVIEKLRGFEPINLTADLKEVKE